MLAALYAVGGSTLQQALLGQLAWRGSLAAPRPEASDRMHAAECRRSNAGTTAPGWSLDPVAALAQPAVRSPIVGRAYRVPCRRRSAWCLRQQHRDHPGWSYQLHHDNLKVLALSLHAGVGAGAVHTRPSKCGGQMNDASRASYRIASARLGTAHANGSFAAAAWRSIGATSAGAVATKPSTSAACSMPTFIMLSREVLIPPGTAGSTASACSRCPGRQVLRAVLPSGSGT